jgi:Ca2+-binding RTX toxin-like protein
MKRAFQAGSAALAAALLTASPALASNATITGGNTVRVTASGSQVNAIFVSYAASTNTYAVFDSTSDITASGTCTAVDSHSVTCPDAGIRTVSVDVGNGNDTILLDRASIPASIEGNLDGDDGSDLILGGRGLDDLSGGGGADTLDGHEGADDLHGNGGTDSLLYTTRTTPVVVTVGSVNANDGNELDATGAARDTVHGDIESVSSGIAGDSLSGDSSSETLNGGEGNDTLIGNNGADSLLGFGGADSIFGGNGDDAGLGGLGSDRILGGPDEDRLKGGPDNDFIWGKKGFDVLKGKGGNDRLNAKDGGRDGAINCGPGPAGLEGAKRDKRHDRKPKSC